MKKIIITVTILLSLTVYESSSAAFKNVKLGEDAPKFNLKEVDGDKMVSLESSFNNKKVILVIFWATWSTRSKNQLKDLNKFMEDYGDKGLEVIAINVEKEEPTTEELALMKEIKDEIQPRYKIVMDSDLSVFYEYGVVAVPSTVIMDGSGAIKKIYDGYPTSALYDMKDDIEIMLGIKAPPSDVQVVVDAGPVILKAAKLHYGMGRKLVERGMGTKAILELEKSASLDEKYDLPLVLLGEVYEMEHDRVKSAAKKTQNLENAAGAFQRALDRSGENLFAYCGLARVYARLGKLDEADKALNGALKIDSNFVTCIVSSGIVLQSKGNHEEAVKEFKKALEFNPHQPDVLLLMAKSYEKLNDYGNSIASLKESFKQLVTKVQLSQLQE